MNVTVLVAAASPGGYDAGGAAGDGDGAGAASCGATLFSWAEAVRFDRRAMSRIKASERSVRRVTDGPQPQLTSSASAAQLGAAPAPPPAAVAAAGTHTSDAETAPVGGGSCLASSMSTDGGWGMPAAPWASDFLLVTARELRYAQSRWGSRVYVVRVRGRGGKEHIAAVSFAADEVPTSEAISEAEVGESPDAAATAERVVLLGATRPTRHAHRITRTRHPRATRVASRGTPVPRESHHVAPP